MFFSICVLTQNVEGDAVGDGPADLVVGDADVDALVLAADVRQSERGAGRRQPPTREVLVVLQRGKKDQKEDETRPTYIALEQCLSHIT